MKKTVRVEIPRNADKMIALAKEVLNRHSQLGRTSPLNSLDMKNFEARIAEAEEARLASGRLKREAEMALEISDALLGKSRDQNSTTPGTILYYLTAARDILLGLNRGSEHKLGMMGYEVHSTPKEAAAKPKEPDKAK